MFAPVVVAKGYDEVASRIKELAREHDIVQVENIQLARALAKEVDIGKTMPTMSEPMDDHSFPVPGMVIVPVAFQGRFISS